MIFEKLREMICEQLKIAEDAVEPGTLVLDDLGADSLDMVDLAMSIEESFDVVIDDNDIEGLKTVGDIVAYIEKNQK